MLRLGLAVAAAVAVADQLVKWWLLGVLAEAPGGIAVTPFFNLVMVWNRGVSFGLFGGGALPPWLLAAAAIAIAVGLTVWLARIEERWLGAAVGAVIGGAVGNVVDRVRTGAVADFFDFHVGVYHWPAFNVADAAITLGVAALLIDALPIGRRDRDRRRIGRPVKLFRDYQGQPVRLTRERLDHILDHPEMVHMVAAMEQTLAAPELVVRSLTDEQVVLAYRFHRDTRMGDKWVCVVVKYTETDAFILTAYLTDKPKKGRQKWPTA